MQTVCAGFAPKKQIEITISIVIEPGSSSCRSIILQISLFSGIGKCYGIGRVSLV